MDHDYYIINNFQNLILITSLISLFDLEFSSIPMSGFDGCILKINDATKFKMSIELAGIVFQLSLQSIIK